MRGSGQSGIPVSGFATRGVAVQYHLPSKLAFHRLIFDAGRRRGFEPLQRTGRRGPASPRTSTGEDPELGSNANSRPRGDEDLSARTDGLLVDCG